MNELDRIMKATLRLSEFQENIYTLITDSQEIKDLLDYVGFCKVWYDDITGVVMLIGEGDYDAVWLTESSQPYDLSAWYRPLPYYKEDNKYYDPFVSYWNIYNSEY